MVEPHPANRINPIVDTPSIVRYTTKTRARSISVAGIVFDYHKVDEVMNVKQHLIIRVRAQIWRTVDVKTLYSVVSFIII